MSPELKLRLRVLLCILSFDDTPYFTARSVKEEAIQNMTMLADELDVTSTRMSNLDLSLPSRINSRLGDPRLVFAYDKDPFREREAGSYKVWSMWKRAEEIVRLQKQEYVAEPHGMCSFICAQSRYISSFGWFTDPMIFEL